MSENNTASGNLVCVSCTLSSCKKESVLEVKKSSGRMLTSPLANFVRPDWLLNKGQCTSPAVRISAENVPQIAGPGSCHL